MRKGTVLALLLLGITVAQSEGQTVELPTVNDSYGRPVDLAAEAKAGHHLVFFFYPKASSPGCTIQAKGYSDRYSEFEALGAQIYGVSQDPAEAQCTFIEELALQGRMIPDHDRRLADLFGVEGLIGAYSRDTVVVSPEGKIAKIWRDTDPWNDPQQVLEYLQETKSSLTTR